MNKTAHPYIRCSKAKVHFLPIVTTDFINLLKLYVPLRTSWYEMWSSLPPGEGHTAFLRFWGIPTQTILRISTLSPITDHISNIPLLYSDDNHGTTNFPGNTIRSFCSFVHRSSFHLETLFPWLCETLSFLGLGPPSLTVLVSRYLVLFLDGQQSGWH